MKDNTAPYFLATLDNAADTLQAILGTAGKYGNCIVGTSDSGECDLICAYSFYARYYKMRKGATRDEEHTYGRRLDALELLVSFKLQAAKDARGHDTAEYVNAVQYVTAASHVYCSLFDYKDPRNAYIYTGLQGAAIDLRGALLSAVLAVQRAITPGRKAAGDIAATYGALKNATVFAEATFFALTGKWPDLYTINDDITIKEFEDIAETAGPDRPFDRSRKWLQEWADGLFFGDKIAPPDYGLQEFFYCFVNE